LLGFLGFGPYPQYLTNGKESEGKRPKTALVVAEAAFDIQLSGMKSKRLGPVFWAVLIFVVAQLITFGVISRENEFLEVNRIYIPPQPPDNIQIWPTLLPPPPPGQTPAPPVGSLGPIVLYFAAVIVVLGIALFLVPVSALKVLLRVIFAFLFAWGIFIISVFWLPWAVALAIALTIGTAWFLLPRVWLHNLAMVLVMVSLGAVFGRLITPWTAMVLVAILALYDFLAVRFGYMMWMTKKLSQSVTLPAFVIPKQASEWNASLRGPAITELVDEDPVERRFSILGGGDVGFPLLLTASVFFAYGAASAFLVALASLLGLIAAYWIQSAFLKGKAMPALPPIAALSLIALTVVRFV